MNDCAFALNNIVYELTGEYADEHKKLIDDLIENHRDTIGEDVSPPFSHS